MCSAPVPLGKSPDFVACPRGCTVQGNKCLADICRPIATKQDDGSYRLVKAEGAEDQSCCLMSLQSPDGASQKCTIIKVCEDKVEVRCLLGLAARHLRCLSQKSSAGEDHRTLPACILSLAVVVQPAPPPEPAEPPSCPSWKLEAHPVASNGGELKLTLADGTPAQNSAADVRIVRPLLPCVLL